MADLVLARFCSRVALFACALLSACSVVAPNSDPSAAASNEPGRPFSQNLCFHCSLRACTIPTRACTYDASCSNWLNCIAECPTDETGVAADGDCIRKCGLPASAEVLFGCVQDYSSGALNGCETACAPLKDS